MAKSFLSHDSLHLFTQSFLTENARASVIILHGLGEHSGRYSEFAGFLNSNGYNVHCFDLRGHGRSQGLRGHVRAFEQYHEDIEYFIEYLEDDGLLTGPVILFGHSLGGLIGLDYLVNYLGDDADYFQAAIFSAPALAIDAPNLAFKYLLCRVAPAPVDTLHIANGVDPYKLSHNQKSVQSYIDDPLVHKWVTAAFFREFIEAQARLESAELRLPIPVLFLVPQQDDVINAEAVLEFAADLKAPGKKVMKFAKMYHEVLHEKSRRTVFEKVNTWMQSAIH